MTTDGGKATAGRRRHRPSFLTTDGQDGHGFLNREIYGRHERRKLFKDPPAEGMLFPYLFRVRAGDRATEFHQRCVALGIKGVSLDSYRYAWAERAKTGGYTIV